MTPLSHPPVAWIAKLSRVGASSEQLSVLLSGPERHRAAQLRHPIDARRFTIARALVRLAVASHTGCEPGDVRIAVDAFGKPHLEHPQAPLSFSIAHGGNLVVVALSAGAIGVDVEPLDQSIALEEVMPLVCSVAECEAIRSMSAPARVQRFLAVWTLKEALLKAIGTGLSSDPSLAEFDLTDESGPVLVDRSARWPAWTFVLDCDVEGHVLALAMDEGTRPSVPVLGDAGALLEGWASSRALSHPCGASRSRAGSS